MRAVGFDGEITLIGDEPHPAYSRPALSKALLRDEEYVSSHLLPPPMHGAKERLGVRVTELDVPGRSLLLDDGDRVPSTGWSSRRAAGRAASARRGPRRPRTS